MNLLKQDPSYMAWENESQRFELWATNLGLYHQGHSSLDYRFRDAASLYSFAYKLLQDLEKCIAIGRLRSRFPLILPLHIKVTLTMSTTY